MRLVVLLFLLASCGPADHERPATARAVETDTGRVRVPGSTLFYEMAGTEHAGAGSPVILLHGGNLDRRMWDAEFAALARTHHVIRYDARGFGRSGPADTSFSAHDDLLVLMDALHVEKASLVGLSMGGRIAMDFALAHPHRVDRMVLVAPGVSGGTWADDADTAWLTKAREIATRRDSVGVARAWLESAYIRTALRDSSTAPIIRQWAEDQAPFWGGIIRHQDLEVEAASPAASRLAELSAPILLVVGTADTPFILDVAHAIQSRAPNVRRVDIPRVGHMVNLEAPAPFLDAVTTFLAR